MNKLGPRIELTIDAKGNVTSEVFGVSGQGCQQLTKQLETALGKVTADRKKSEFYQTQTVQVKQ